MTKEESNQFLRKTQTDVFNEYYTVERCIEHGNAANLELLNYLPPNGDVLDIGCGSGINSIYFASIGRKVFCIDKDEYTINILREKAKNFNIDYIIGSIPEIELPKRKFAIVIASQILHFLKMEQARLFAEQIDKALIKGGFLVLVVHSEKHPSNEINKAYFDKYYSLADLESLFPKEKYIRRIVQDKWSTNHPKYINLVKEVYERFYFELKKSKSPSSLIEECLTNLNSSNPYNHDYHILMEKIA